MPDHGRLKESQYVVTSSDGSHALRVVLGGSRIFRRFISEIKEHQGCIADYPKNLRSLSITLQYSCECRGQSRCDFEACDFMDFAKALATNRSLDYVALSIVLERDYLCAGPDVTSMGFGELAEAIMVNNTLHTFVLNSFGEQLVAGRFDIGAFQHECSKLADALAVNVALRRLSLGSSYPFAIDVTQYGVADRLASVFAVALKANTTLHSLRFFGIDVVEPSRFPRLGELSCDDYARSPSFLSVAAALERNRWLSQHWGNVCRISKKCQDTILQQVVDSMGEACFIKAVSAYLIPAHHGQARRQWICAQREAEEARKEEARLCLARAIEKEDYSNLKKALTLAKQAGFAGTELVAAKKCLAQFCLVRAVKKRKCVELFSAIHLAKKAGFLGAELDAAQNCLNQLFEEQKVRKFEARQRNMAAVSELIRSVTVTAHNLTAAPEANPA